eukprot:Clim_evm4s12 gene=Clim_evmTU4s12
MADDTLQAEKEKAIEEQKNQYQGVNSHLRFNFYDKGFIQARGGLHPHNILEYFSLSPFYDRQCTNELAAQAMQDPQARRQYKGTEYELVYMSPPPKPGTEPSKVPPVVFVIEKRFRSSPEKISTLAYYYCVDGSIFLAPTLDIIVKSRLLNSLHFLRSAMKDTAAASRFTPTVGYFWKYSEALNQSTKGSKDTGADISTTIKERKLPAEIVSRRNKRRRQLRQALGNA